MNRVVKYFSGLTALVLCTAVAFAQRNDSIYTDIDFLLKQNSWVTSRNATGLRYFPVKQFMTAGASLEKTDGGFRNYYESDNGLAVNAATKAWSGLNEKVMVQGGIRYNNFTGKNMTGSVFINPYENIMGMEEYTDSNAGNKQLESYNVNGAVSAQLTSRMSLGGSVDFGAANYAKRKDLRHSNFLTNIDAGLGLGLEIGERVTLGASYHYIRRIESLKFESFGNKDVQYLGFANFGLFMGRAEIFEGNGTVGNGFISYTKRPFVNQTHEASVQLGVNFSAVVNAFGEFSYGAKNGYYGKKGNTQIIYTEHNADVYSYTMGLNIKKGSNQYMVNVKGGYEGTSNFANVYDRVTDQNNRSIIAYYGQNKVTDRNTTHLQVNFIAFIDVANNLPRWKLQLGGNYFGREQIVNQYPFFRRQDVKFNSAFIDLAHNSVKSNGLISYLLNLEYGRGRGEPRVDSYYVEPDEDQVRPQTTDVYLHREFEYLTSPRFVIAPGFQYTVTKYENIKPYVKIIDRYTTASGTQYLKTHFNQFNFSVGCYF